jgi:hypothetical protein
MDLAIAASQHSESSLAQRIGQLLDTQLVGVLATNQSTPTHSGQPYTSLMAFAHTPDLRYLIIATLKETQKHANLLQNACLSLLIDNRCNSVADYQQAVAISVIGRAEIIPADAAERLQALFLGKHPQLRAFVLNPECALLRISVQCYRVVSEFQATEVYKVAP